MEELTALVVNSGKAKFQSRYVSNNNDSEITWRPRALSVKKEEDHISYSLIEGVGAVRFTSYEKQVNSLILHTPKILYTEVSYRTL